MSGTSDYLPFGAPMVPQTWPTPTPGYIPGNITFYPAPPQPCPKCGYCPTCGQSHKEQEAKRDA